MSTVAYRPRSTMAPHKTVVKRHKVFTPTRQGVFIFDLEDEGDFLSIPKIQQAVDSCWLYRDGPYPDSELPPVFPNPVETAVPNIREQRTKRRQNKEPDDVPVDTSVDQGDVLADRPAGGKERDTGLYNRADHGDPSDQEPDSRLEDAE